MCNLLSAGFHRLWKNKVFWLGLFAMLAFSAGAMLNDCRQAAVLLEDGYIKNLDDCYFNLAPMLGLFCAVFTSLFILFALLLISVL